MQFSCSQHLEVARLPDGHELKDWPSKDSTEVAGNLEGRAPAGASLTWLDDAVSQSGPGVTGVEKEYCAVYALSRQAISPDFQITGFLFC